MFKKKESTSRGRGTEKSRTGGPGGRTFGRRREKKEDVLMARMKKKTCRFCEEKITTLDYKDYRRLERLISERGKILSRRVTGTCAKHQRKVEDAVKKARFIALLPFLKG
ncbi:MAG: 30S ribosomal protein S18 [Candidatus Omnitrophica bacterium]|nr:30S ribosomal protein S18 [Candidatus Omnitrophota bacterium]